MKLLCDCCGRDLDEIWQDNMSHEPGVVLCEDCGRDEEREPERCMETGEYYR